MIFPNLELEAIVQVDDRTRLSAVKTYADKSGPSIVKVEIEPHTGLGFINVTNVKPDEWYTDYQYDSAGAKVVTLKINGDTTPVTKTFGITVISSANDMLFSSDTDLISEEPDVLRYVRKGRNTFKDAHREAQKEILDQLNRQGFRTSTGLKLTATDLIDKSEVRTMSKYMALFMIYDGLSNVVGDIFELKANNYWSKYLVASDRKIIGIDLNGDDVITTSEGVNIRGARMVRK